MVQIWPGRSRGSERYLPFPVPESKPTHPAGKLDRKLEIIGQGYPNNVERKKEGEQVLPTLYRVDEKCAAIVSYIACTLRSSYSSGFPSTVTASKA
jgi:hypothetical protein